MIRTPVGLLVGAAFVATTVQSYLTPQAPAVRPVDERMLREYTGVYRWSPDAFLYLQLWQEFSGAGIPQLVAFDESGEVRVMYPTERDAFFAGPGAAVATSVESRIQFERDRSGRIESVTWTRDGTPARTARRVEIERQEDVVFANGDVRLAGRLTSPITSTRHPAVILVHGSGAQDREAMLPLAHFLVRHGIAVFGYDKRGVGGSTGDWYTETFDDLAGDVVSAFNYLKTRRDVDARQVGLLGISQAGWIMPLAAIRAKDLAFLISISGAAVPAAETVIDHAINEMKGSAMPAPVIEQIVGLMKLQLEFARTGRGWDDYAATRQTLVARAKAAGVDWPPPDLFPETPDHRYWGFMRRLYFYDPAPTLRQLTVPTLAIFGELDDNILPEKNSEAWDAALKAAGNRDYTIRILPKANHGQFEAKTGTNTEAPTLQRFVPEYARTVQEWLSKRIRGYQVR
jgi:pimeloyl-ACP methyl ester carboxylesterase